MRGWWHVILILMLLAVGSDLRGEIVIPPPIVHTPDLVARGPDLTLTRTTGDWHTAGFFPEGDRFYIVADEKVVNIWAVLVYFWPVIPTLITMWIAWRMVRSIIRACRSRDAVGQPHCRRCGYRLTACTSPACPECGASLARYVPCLAPPLRGAVARRCVVMAVMLGAVIGLWTADVPRTGTVSTWFQWTNQSLNQPGSIFFTSSWWDKFTTHERVLLEYDATSGRPLARYKLGYIYLSGSKDLFSISDALVARLWGGISVDDSDDGRYLGVEVYAPRRYVVFDCSTRRVVDFVATTRNTKHDEAAEIRDRYGLTYVRSEMTPETAMIDGEDLLYSTTKRTVRLDEDDWETGEREGTRVLLNASVPSHSGKRWRSYIVQPVVGDLKIGHWFARLDVSAIDSSFLRLDLNAKGDRVLARTRDDPKKLLIYDLSQELSRVPSP